MKHTKWLWMSALGLSLGAGLACQQVTLAQVDETDEPAPEVRRQPAIPLDARRLMKKADDYLQINEEQQGVKILESILERYPSNQVRFHVYLRLGKHFQKKGNFQQAITYLKKNESIVAFSGNEEIKPDLLEIYLESLYLTGISFFQLKQYNKAFPPLRKITGKYPNTVWANQAYYYIGMCHFKMANWNQAIRALSLVGTFVDTEDPTIQFVEAGRRFFIKVKDSDLPIEFRLKKTARVTARTSSGDSVTTVLVPLSEKEGVYIASIGTAMGTVDTGDSVLQIKGGDQITAEYTDLNSENGEKDLLRDTRVMVVSSGAASFTQGDRKTAAVAAFIGQPLFIQGVDADLDVSEKSDTMTVKVISRYEMDEDALAREREENLDALSIGIEQQERFRTRDEVTLVLNETAGKDPSSIHTGLFNNTLDIKKYDIDQEVDKEDGILIADISDEIVLVYMDEKHIGGDTPRTRSTSIVVLGELDSVPKASQKVITDPTIKARQHLLEGEAYLELARIFKGMGLLEGASEKAGQGLDLANDVIAINAPIDKTFIERAYKLKWELYLAQGRFQEAIETCQTFNQLFPDSPFVDQALLGIAKTQSENGQFNAAISVYRQILELENSQAKADAQYGIATALEAQADAMSKLDKAAGDRVYEQAVREFKVVTERYPNSAWAGPALGRLVQYRIKTKDYARADNLLEQIFQDYPDDPFLDEMLLKWAVLSFRMGDYVKAKEKCQQLIFDYPESRHAATASAKILPVIENRLKRGSE